MDQDDAALHAWEEATRLPENPSTYLAWRNVAAARVRAQDLRGAFDAYREAEKRAPEQDRTEIANRLGWLSKELGDTSAAGKYFARARGDQGLSFTVVIIAITTIISLTVDLTGPVGNQILDVLLLDKVAVADGELWRLWTVTLVHGGLLHLLFNMYALWLAGPLVERLYGRWRFLLFYLLFALGGSLASFAFSDSRYAVGASGAIFGLFGLLFAAEQIHKPILDRQSRAFLGQLGGLLVINLIFGFVVPNIDNMAHIGGLVTGCRDRCARPADARADDAVDVDEAQHHGRAGAGLRGAGQPGDPPRGRPDPARRVCRAVLHRHERLELRLVATAPRTRPARPARPGRRRTPRA